MSQIVKAKREDKFVTIPNELARDNSLSLKARGLITYLLSMADDWVIYKSKLHTQVKDGREGVNKAFNELVAAGYILEVKTINEKTGQFIYDYIVYSEPVLPPLTGSRTREAVNGKPYTESRKPNTNTINKEKEQIEIESVPKFNNALVYERHWPIPVPEDLKQAWDTTPLLAEKWEAFCVSRFQSHNIRYASDIQESTAIRLFVKKCGTVNKAIASLDICISKGYKHPDYYNTASTGTKPKEIKRDYLGRDISKMA